ncbi:MAG: hypothetical protein GTO55_02130 [Armatimonadetes bacterium]|nr:hypothetical protein [Armatimonadota bacterium]NIM23077.1 hypothetical protein [Armatimonadota bacterium]NIM66945.1 hypothetical protein [Armatimonadota bacterium]NIM75479.1 hypothetical protein [Armatimonadota bacterium]NIN05136.1 hypothetical protein [Armatimonadota bacterium]
MNSLRALTVLTPAESKRLIAKGVAAMPEVRNALDKGRLIISNGTTNAFVAEELLGIEVPKVKFAAGIVAEGRLGVTDNDERLPPFVTVKGKRVDTSWQEVLREFEAPDVFIKGANAVDPEGVAGVLVASPEGGTVGASLGILGARGCHLIAPVGLERLVPSVMEATRHMGIGRIHKAMGFPCGLVPLPAAQVITEVQALQELAEVEVWHVASGGIAGAEGAVVLVLEGDEKEVEKAFSLIESVKGEPPVKAS